MLRFKIAAQKQIFVSCENSHVTKIWKNHFSNGIFQWNLAQSRKDMNTFTFLKWNLKNNIILFKNGGQNKICDVAQ